MVLTLETSSFASVALVSMLYGVFFGLFSGYLFLAVQDRPAAKIERRAVCKPMPFIGSILLFCMITPHWILVTWRSLQAFIYSNDGAEPTLFYTNPRSLSWLLEATFLVATVVSGDCLLIYRVWVVWGGSRYIVVFPVLSLLGGIASFIGLSYAQSLYQLDDNVALSRMEIWGIACYASTLGTNLYSCALICWRLWRYFSVSTLNWHGRRDITTRTIAIFVESAAIYVIWIFVSLMACVKLGNSAFGFATEGAVPITGIAFMLINVRVKLGYAIDSNVTRRDVSAHSLQFNSSGTTVQVQTATTANA